MTTARAIPTQHAPSPRSPELQTTTDGTLSAFVQHHRHPEPPLTSTRPLRLSRGTRTAPTYRIHGYWSKKPHEVLATCIDTYTRPGDLILDPFCGSGGTLLMASAAGRIGIGIDRSPAAAFITRTSLSLPTGSSIKNLHASLLQRVGDQIDELYATRCHRCDGVADTRFTVTSDRYRCTACLTHFLAEDALADGRAKLCPHCRRALPRRRPRDGEAIVEIAARCRGRCRPRLFRRRYDDPEPTARAAFHEFDLPSIARATDTPPAHWFPTNSFPSGLKTAELFGRGIFSVHQLFTPRNLHAIATLRAGIDTFPDDDRQTLLLVLTAALMSLSLKAQHLEGGGGYLPGMYYVPPVRKERSPMATLPRIVGQIAGAADALHASACYPSPSWTGVGNAIDLTPIPDESIDFAFLDPPYSDKIQFSELNLVWESWLGLADDWGDDELVLNSARGKSAAEWGNKIDKLATGIRRVLKPGARTVITYTDSHRGTFQTLLDAFRNAGFDVLDSTTHIETVQSTYVQRTSRGAEQRHPLLVLRRK
jgi:DNA modification methylase/DNA-directed RNA polymerase subunit RPC12/RpoP